MIEQKLPVCFILGMKTNVLSSPIVIQQISEWCRAADRKGRYVCVSNVHMCMEAHDHPEFCAVVNQADLVVPDGRPLFWMQKLAGFKQATQIRGMDLTLALCQEAEKQGFSVGFYGGQSDVLNDLMSAIHKKYPALKVVYAVSPPYRVLSPAEDQQCIDEINQKHPHILFIGLGCPKQERWMNEHRDRIHSAMVGVGAAFDFISGHKKSAPRWIQRLGVEWLFRLLCEPRRLWRRYMYTNFRFLFFIIKEKLSNCPYFRRSM
jgi:N-acetylglucosaminyldiphosphoundecaprenol N-acetyl-beta-D-mannosaminyltransferase